VISDHALINILRERLNYHFKRETDRVVIYKQRGATKRIEIRKVSAHDEDYVRILLRQAGLGKDEIEKFIVTHRTH
jgi:hypothetical protein